MKLKKDYLEKQGRRDRGELAKVNENLENELEVARKTIAKLKAAVRGIWTSRGTECRAAERRTTDGSRGGPSQMAVQRKEARPRRKGSRMCVSCVG